MCSRIHLNVLLDEEEEDYRMTRSVKVNKGGDENIRTVRCWPEDELKRVKTRMEK